jgi:hypothetical protein
MNGQLEIMNGQLGVMQNDERAWIAVRKNPPKGEEILAIDLIEGQPVVVPMKYINVGKTPALHPQMHIFAEVVDADKEAHFKCMDAEENCPGLKGNISIAGIVFPNGDMPVIVSRQSPTTNAEVSAWNNDRNYVAVYGIIRYDDIFRHQHWTKFCFYLGNDRISLPMSSIDSIAFNTAGCTMYNSSDEQQDAVAKPKETRWWQFWRKPATASELPN